jgi:hypothetical protein
MGAFLTRATPNPGLQLARMWFACRLVDLACLAELLASSSLAARLGRAARSMVPEAEAFLKP